MRRKILMMMAAFAIMICLVGGDSITAHAGSINETEPNNTKLEAQLIKANNQKPSDLPSEIFSEQVIKGTTSNEDQDWFKVFLTAGINYMSCNGDPYNFSIENESGSYYLQNKYWHSKQGITPYKLTVPESGYYYVKITGMTSSTSSYLFAIGGPTYDLGKIEVSSQEGSITMRSGRTQTANFNITNNNNLPERAIVYFIRMDGLKTTSAKNVSVSNSQGNSISLQQYVWQKNGLATLNMEARDNWRATFTYHKDTTFTPTLVLRYVYPVIE
ncbi:hypothetical protein [Aminipila sp.]|uniref:hypothetical protein n=1 Tax=Aminipila sp. TaxID=2060095 RepID=UPI00289FF398|nr:hypothetical protein [Aminipila sp.]